MRRPTHVLRLWLLLLGAVLSTQPAAAQSSVSLHLMMGNPSDAKADEAQPDNYLVLHPQWAASWNASKGHPNWVSWRLAADDIGSADRDGLFFTSDKELPASCSPVYRREYVASGFDLGHLCPAQDRSRHLADLRATFSTANCFPQAPMFNRGDWARAEAWRRSRALAGNELYCVAGAAGTAGQGERGWKTSIGTERRVNVPAVAWFAFLELPEQSGDDVARVTTETVGVAAILRNDEADHGDWTTGRESIDEVERLTGYNLFSLVASDAQRSVEGRKHAD